jgi:transcription-repair coupling factor (superfamily II helicase)
VDKTESLFAYLPRNALLVLPQGFAEHMARFYAEADERFQQRRFDVNRPLLPPARLFLDSAESTALVEGFCRVQLCQADDADWALQSPTLPDITLDSRLKEPGQRLRQFIEGFANLVDVVNITELD